MKKTIFKIVALLVVLIVMSVPVLALADSGAPEPAQITETVETEDEAADISGIVIEYAVSIAATLLITLIGVLGTWLTTVFSRSEKYKNINAAQKELIRMAKITVGELKQTVSDNLKAASKTGKLSNDEIKGLQTSLLLKTKQKMSGPALDLLAAASVDINNLILGAGDAWIDKLKTQEALLIGESIDMPDESN